MRLEIFLLIFSSCYFFQKHFSFAIQLSLYECHHNKIYDCIQKITWRIKTTPKMSSKIFEKNKNKNIKELKKKKKEHVALYLLYMKAFFPLTNPPLLLPHYTCRLLLFKLYPTNNSVFLFLFFFSK